MLAVAREVPRSIAAGERTHVPRRPIDLERARDEHGRYLEALSALGCEILLLEEEPELPDSVFVEDVACVFDELAVVTRPGAPARRAETPSVAAALRPFRSLATIEAPATLDGGDVLVLGRSVLVGRSSRSDPGGVAALADLLQPHGYAVASVPLSGCLHLKSAACVVAPDTVLANPAWVDPGRLGAARVIEVDADEPFAANALRVGEALVHSDAFPRTRARLEAAGLSVVPVPAGELALAEGGVTCCSLVFPR